MFVDSIWLHIKTNNNRIEQEHCFYIWDNLHDTIHHYIADNKVFNKKHYSWYKNVVTRPPRALTIYLL